MTTNEHRTSSTDSGHPASRRTRKPYSPPVVTFEEQMEALASVCSTSPGKAAFPCTVNQS